MKKIVLFLAATVLAGSLAFGEAVVGKPAPAFTAKDINGKVHKLSDLARGKTEVQLVAEFSGTARYEKKASETKRARGSKKDSDRVIQKGLDITYNRLVPEYPALLFPSNTNTGDVFRLTATVAEPAPALDKLFENAQAVLEK